MGMEGRTGNGRGRGGGGHSVLFQVIEEDLVLGIDLPILGGRPIAVTDGPSR